MKFDKLLDQFNKEAWFDYASVALLFPEGDAAIRTSLYRLKKTGRLLELRRGLYAFPERYRKATLTGPSVANALYQPSYLSTLWALSFYGVIPEKTVTYTSVSPRPTKSFENSLGLFSYRSLQPALFAGFVTESIMASPVRIATPEKALLDLMYLEEGEWTEERMESMRFEPGAIALEPFLTAMEGTGIARLQRAAVAWKRYASDVEKGRINV